MKAQRGRIFSKLKQLWPFVLIAAVGFSAYWLTSTAMVKKTKATTLPQEAAKNQSPFADTLPIHRKPPHTEGGRLDSEALANGAIPNQRVLIFKSKAALEAFLANLGGGVYVLDKMNRFNALLVGFRNADSLTGLLDGSEETSFNFPAGIPDFDSVGPQAGAVALGSDLLKWLGIEGDNSLWGTGVKIAVLDTGIADHLVFNNAIERINLVALPADLAELNGHGTAVASLIFSNNPYAPGVAPGATPLSIRIANDDGSSTSWLIAQGILAALDSGAQVINISLGGQGHSAVTDSAIAEAQRLGVPIIAAAGNSGREGVLQPAANPYVIAVGAVDRNNQKMSFSTTGAELAVSAVGFGLNVAYPGNKAAQVSGTSFSAPIFTALIGGFSSLNGKQTSTTTQSANLLLTHLNDIGSPGRDNQTGGGVPNVGTILSPRTYDASVNSIIITNGKNGSQAHVLVQNVGMHSLLNTGVTVNVNGTQTTANITTLAPMQSHVISVPIPSGPLTIQGSIQNGSGPADQRPSNNSLTQIIPAEKP